MYSESLMLQVVVRIRPLSDAEQGVPPQPRAVLCFCSRLMIMWDLSGFVDCGPQE